MSRRRIGILVIVVLLLCGAGYAVAARRATPAGGGRIDPTATGTVLFVDDATKRIGQLRLDGTETLSEVSCLRVYSAGGTTICMRAVAVPPSFEAALLGPDLGLIRTIKLDGIPSRARVSRSGKLIGWTVFRTGDSYLPAGYFSTTAGIYDRESKNLIGSLEDLTSITNANFWGITFAADDRTFYATVAVDRKNTLVRGDIATRTLTPVREGVECPSLSPDGTRIVYKGPGWRLHVLDLATGKDIPLADPAAVDDQAAWLNDGTVLYTRPPSAGQPPAIFTVPADGTGSPRLLRERASSPGPL